MRSIRATTRDLQIAILTGISLLCATPPLAAQEKPDGGVAGAPSDEGGIAAIGPTFTYQGVIKQSGTPINGLCDLQFSLWSAAAGPAQVGSTQQFLNHNVANGLLTNDLNFGAGSFDGNDRWMQVAVRFPAGSGSYTTLAPRQKINAAPYALFSVGGNTGFALPYTASASSALDLLTLTNTFNGGAGYSGRVGGPDYGVVGKHNVTGNLGFVGHASYGLYGITESLSGIGVRGSNAATGHDGELGDPAAGALGQHLPSGNNGKLGTANYGVLGITNLIDSGVAIRGQHTVTGNYANLGHHDFGVDGVVAGSEDTGVRGYHGPTGNYGMLGSNGQGVLGAAANAASYGVYGSNLSQENFGALGGAFGVIGHSTSGGALKYGRLAGSNFAGDFYASGPSNTGVIVNSQGVGIEVESTSTTAPAVRIEGASQNGVLQVYSPIGFCARFWGGHVTIENDLYCDDLYATGIKSFRIDHPLDPGNKYLVHACVESDKARNIYDGVTLTDEQGFAQVELPSYFDALNCEYRYQLTIIDDGNDFVLAKVTREIEGNRFQIRTSRPAVKVSWQVTGVRNDPYARAHPWTAEQDKPPGEQGKYLSPREHGQPPELSILPSPIDAPEAQTQSSVTPTQSQASLSQGSHP